MSETRTEPVGDIDMILNDILSRWHSWSCDDRSAVGYPTISVCARQYRTSRQYDDANGAMDQDIENVIMAGVDACVWSVPQPFCTAICFNALNLCTGLSVWHSPRLPADGLARAFMVSDAREMLLSRLQLRELI